MKRLLVVGVVAVMGALPAQASTILCVPPNAGAVDTIYAPANPSFFIERDRVGDFGANRPDGRSLPFTTKVVNEFWSQVKVKAPAGTDIQIPLLQSRCKARRIVRTSARWVRDDRAPQNVFASKHYDNGMLSIGLELEAQLSSVRVDWAYTANDLRAGLHATIVDVPARGLVKEVAIPAGRTFDIVVVRLTPLLLDGTTGRSWEGWIRRDPATGTLSLGEGSAPTSRAVTPCPVKTPWPAGENPTFMFQDSRRTFRAIGRNGRVLKTTVVETSGLSEMPGTTDVTVSARDGELFRLEALPVGAGCPIEVRVVRGGTTPRVVLRGNLSVRIPTGPFTREERFLYMLDSTKPGRYEHVILGIDTDESHVMASYGNTSWDGEHNVLVQRGTITLPTSDFRGDWTFPDINATGDLVRIRLAPTRDGFQGRACEAWLARMTRGRDAISLHAERPIGPLGPPGGVRTLDSCMKPPGS